MKKFKRSKIISALLFSSIALTTLNAPVIRAEPPTTEPLSVPTARSGSVEISPSAQPPHYFVIACNDGDTCRLRASDNTQIKVRLVGIDAPETSKKKKMKKTEGQQGASEAKKFLNELVVGKSVTVQSYGTDMYGRNLAEIRIQGESANLKMVSEGWAEVYRGKPPAGFNLEPFERAQELAQKSKKGVWGLGNYESPKDFRKRTKH